MYSSNYVTLSTICTVTEQAYNVRIRIRTHKVPATSTGSGIRIKLVTGSTDHDRSPQADIRELKVTPGGALQWHDMSIQ